MTPWLDDGDVQLYHGDVTETLRALPAGIAQTCVTSPPYWGLRDYGTGAWTGGYGECAHVAGPARNDGATLRTIDAASGRRPAAETYPTDDGGTVQYRTTCAKCGARRVDSQLGLEATPAEYVERLVEVFREVWRVLRDDGTVWLNLGDSYAGGGGYAPDAPINQRRANGEDWGKFHPASTSALSAKKGTGKVPGLKPKDLVGIPWRVAFALQADGWYLRSDVIWSKPNPMPESVTDRPTKAHEYLFLLSKQPRYYYDQEAIREDGPSYLRKAGGYTARGSGIGDGTGGQDGRRAMGFRDRDVETVGRNRRSVWTIPTQPFPEAHFATFPEALVRPCILAGTSAGGECSGCGMPLRRLQERVDVALPSSDCKEYDRHRPDGWMPGAKVNVSAEYGKPGSADFPPRVMNQLGWEPSCTCDAPTRPQTVLDPFIGSGTTAHVARKHGRRCIGIDLSAEYLEIAARRLAQQSLLGGVQLTDKESVEPEAPDYACRCGYYGPFVYGGKQPECPSCGRYADEVSGDG